MKSIWFFEDVNLFKILCPHKFKQYKKTHDFSAYRKSDYIYFQEDASNKIYLIEKGKVKIGYYNENGDEIVKAILSKGELFGAVDQWSIRILATQRVLDRHQALGIHHGTRSDLGVDVLDTQSAGGGASSRILCLLEDALVDGIVIRPQCVLFVGFLGFVLVFSRLLWR